MESPMLRLMAFGGLVAVFSTAAAAAEDIKVGIIGLDTSHVVAFTELLNDRDKPGHVPGARVVAAYRGGSPDIPASADRLEKFTSELKSRWGVEIVETIPALCGKVDAVLLESVDGRKHLEQLLPVLAARKPVFIDKPLAGTLADAREIVRRVKEAGVPCFSASALRFYPGVTGLGSSQKVGEVLGCDAYSPASLEPHHPDLYWYGVHGVEILYAVMGPGCESVTRVAAPDFDVVVGRWRDGRIGTYRGLRKGKQPYGATVFGTQGHEVLPDASGSIYRPLLEEVVKFFRSGKAPVALDETLEMFAFMEAADESKRRSGAPVKLSELVVGEKRDGGGQ